MRKLSIILLTILCAILTVSCGADQAVKKGDKFYAVGEYYDAATQYRKAYTQTPSKERTLQGATGHEVGRVLSTHQPHQQGYYGL